MGIKQLDTLLITPIREENSWIVPPIGLGYLATALRKHNFSVDILDSGKENLNFEEFRANLIKRNPQVIGIQMFSNDYSDVKKLIKFIKKINPSITIILGGAHPSSVPLEVLNQFKDADYAFKGEAEEGLPLLMNLLLRNKKVKMEKIPGLIWRKGKKIIVNNQIFNPDLDKYGIPAWDLIDPRTYKQTPQAGYLSDYHYAPISTSRGCPFCCTYCTVHLLSGRRIRFRSFKSIIDEIKLLKNKYGVKEFHIIDDAFTASKKRVIEFCNELIKNKIDIKFTFPNGIRLDTLDREVLLKMKQAGLRYFSVGIESGSDKILKDMKKNLTTKIIEEKTKLIDDVGLIANGFFILGYPTETRQDILKTIEFAKKIPIKRALFTLFKAYPGTEITNHLLETGEIKGVNYDSIIYYKTGYVPKGMTAAELKKLQRKAFFEFYLRPKILINFLREMNSFEHFRFVMRRAWFTLFKSK